MDHEELATKVDEFAKLNAILAGNAQESDDSRIRRHSS